MTHSHYVTIHLDELSYITEDSTAIIQFPTPLQCYGEEWSVALTEIDLKFISTPDVLVCCNICTESYVNDRLFQLLRSVTHKPGEEKLFSLPYYIPVQSSTPISRIRFTFRETNGTVIPNPIGNSLTLHFLKKK